MKKRIKNKMMDVLDRVQMCRERHIEVRKFHDKRRVKIWSSVNLSAEQKRQIDDLYKRNYGHRIPYTWHRHYTAFTHRFDPNYIPELLYIPEFERFMNLDSAYIRCLADKNMLPYLASRGGGTDPENLSAGILWNLSR